MSQKEFYVYFHRKETDNEIFYVGKGKGKRAYIKNGRNSYWKNVFDKHGLVVEIHKSGLTEQEALDLEVLLIKELSEKGCKLCNLTDGGEGLSGYKFSEEGKQKISENSKRFVQENREANLKSIAKAIEAKKNMIITEEIRERMAKAQLGKKQDLETINKRIVKSKQTRRENDKTYYFFFNAEGDGIFSKKLEFADYLGVSPRVFRSLFSSSSKNMTAKGWFVIKDFQTLFLFLILLNYKESKNDLRN